MSAPPILEPSFSTVLIASSTWTLLWSSGLPLEGVQTYGSTPGALIPDGGQPDTAGGRGIDTAYDYGKNVPGGPQQDVAAVLAATGTARGDVFIHDAQRWGHFTTFTFISFHFPRLV